MQRFPQLIRRLTPQSAKSLTPPMPTDTSCGAFFLLLIAM